MPCELGANYQAAQISSRVEAAAKRQREDRTTYLRPKLLESPEAATTIAAEDA